MQGNRSRLVDVPQCPIAMEAINEAFPAIRKEAQDRASTYKKGVTLLLRAHADGVETNHRAVISEQVNGLNFHFLAGDFFQNNPFILPEFVNYVASRGSSGRLHPPRRRLLRFRTFRPLARAQVRESGRS